MSAQVFRTNHKDRGNRKGKVRSWRLFLRRFLIDACLPVAPVHPGNADSVEQWLLTPVAKDLY
jgi:hypothetical protein